MKRLTVQGSSLSAVASAKGGFGSLGASSGAMRLLPLQPHISMIAVRGFKQKKKPKKEEEEGGEVSAAKRFDEALWKLRPQWVTLTRTYEQLAEEEVLVKSYSKLKMRETINQNRQRAKMLKMKLDALNHLPPDLRAEAQIEDMTPPPRERVIPLWTAPIPNYQDSLPPEQRDEPFDFTKLSTLTRKRST